MTGVGFSRDPTKKVISEEDEIHLWKTISTEEVQTYCQEITIENKLNHMTQVTKSSLDSWENNDSVCDECVESVRNMYY